MDLGLKVVYQVYALPIRDLANSLKHSSLSLVPCIEPHGVNESAHLLYSTPIPSIERVEFWGFISFGIRLVKELCWKRGISRELLRDP